MSVDQLLTKSYLSFWLIENSLRYMYRDGRPSLFDEHKWVDLWIGRSKVADQISAQKKVAGLNLKNAFRDYNNSRTYEIQSPIEYSTFGDLVTIGKNHFPHWFKHDSKRAFELCKKMEWINGPRNDLAHSRLILESTSDHMHATARELFKLLNLSFKTDEESVEFFVQSRKKLSPQLEVRNYLALLTEIEQAFAAGAAKKTELATNLRKLIKEWVQGPWQLHAMSLCNSDKESMPCHMRIIQLVKAEYRLTSSVTISPAVQNYSEVNELIKKQLSYCDRYNWIPEVTP